MSNSLERLIRKAKVKFGDRFSFGDSTYIDYNSPITITCKVHGKFVTTPKKFINSKYGCPKCSRKKRTLESFIKEATKRFNEFYDYSESVYVNTDTPIKIVCPIHGAFYKLPHEHLKGKGCPLCSRYSSFKNKNDWFIYNAKLKHGDKYNYDLVTYNMCTKYVKIICPIHGEFIQRAKNHLAGHGCPHCKESSLENEVAVKLKELNIDFIYDHKCFEWMDGLRFDFYLPAYNIVIECQGKQHFMPVAFNGNIEKANLEFTQTSIRDLKKYQLCKKHNIPIYYYAPDFYGSTSKLYKENTYNNLTTLLNDIQFK